LLEFLPMSLAESGQYKNLTELDVDCIIKARIVGTDCNLYPAVSLPYISGSRYPYPIRGRWGVQLQMASEEVEEGRIAIAQTGFNVDGNRVKITNSPQGINRMALGYFSTEAQKEILRELKKGEFRDILLNQVISLARRLRNLGVDSVYGVSAYNHAQVEGNEGGTLPYERAIKSMDLLYGRHGFTTIPGGDYILTL